jgi:hypothetical protein
LISCGCSGFAVARCVQRRDSGRRKRSK